MSAVIFTMRARGSQPIRSAIIGAVDTLHAPTRSTLPAKPTRRPTRRVASVKKERAPEHHGRRERNKRDKRERIVESARSLFKKQGYSSTTSQQIARGAQIAAGTLFLYVKSKEDLLVLVFTNEMRDLIEDAFRDIDADAALLDQTNALFKRFVVYHARDVAIARELIRELTFLSNRDRIADVAAIVRAILDKLIVFIERAIERRELEARTDPELLANCLFSVYYQQLQTWLSGYVPRRQFERSLSAMLDQIIGGCRR
jgi:AcrR family transcriptional regulator